MYSRPFGSKSSPFAFPFELKFDRELFRQKIKQVDIQIELPGELFQQVATRRIALVMLDIVEVGAEIALPSSFLICAASCRCVRCAFLRACAITSPKVLI